MNIDAFEDFKVNNNASWYTRNVYTNLPNVNFSIGRVDHMMKTSIKSIVNACVKQVIKREGKVGVHTITIELSETLISPVTKTLTINVNV